MSQYGKYYKLCRATGSRHATLPTCNLFSESPARGGEEPWFGGCNLTGIALGGDTQLANLGSIVIAAIAIAVCGLLLMRTEKKRAAVGRREMQFFLIGFVIIEICEIFTIGGFPLSGVIRRAFTAAHIAAIVATTWILMMNGAVGYQLIDDGTAKSMIPIFGSAAVLFIGTGYIALDTAFKWTGYWNDTLTEPNRALALYTMHQVVPLLFLVIFFLLEVVLVLRVLGETRPMLYLSSAALLFVIGQVFQYIASPHICTGTSGAINGGLFATLFTLLAVVMIWIFWSSITEDDWPVPATGADST